jgi:hypothetical protein
VLQRYVIIFKQHDTFFAKDDMQGEKYAKNLQKVIAD